MQTRAFELDSIGPIIDTFGPQPRMGIRVETLPITPTRSGMPADWLWCYLEKKGIDETEICEALGRVKDQLISETGVMPVEPYLQFLNWAAKRLHTPLLGAYLAREVAPSEFGLVGHLIANGPSLRESLDFMERYHCIFSPDFTFLFSYCADAGRCRYQEAEIANADSREDIDFGLGLVANLLQQYAGGNWYPLNCSFSYPAPENIVEHKAFFGESLSFSQPYNAIEFELELLDTPNPQADLSLLPILLNQANQLLDKLQTQIDIVHKVRLLVTTSLGYTTLSAEAMANNLNVSVRHLHRLLSERGTTFRKIKEETVLQVAKEALTETNLSITEVAMKLNYSESSAFDRMFKKQAGMTPLQYRKRFSN